MACSRRPLPRKASETGRTLVRCAEVEAPLSAALRDVCIPFWYRNGMSTQIAVRLPDDMVRFIDQLVERGRGSSRAAVIARALDRERRHETAVQDAAIYAQAGEDADMIDLVQHLSGQPMDPDQ